MAIMILAGILYFLEIGNNITAPLAHTIIFSSVGYTIFYGFFHRKEFANAEIREKTKTFKIITLLMFPFMVMDSVIPDFKLVPYNLTMPVYFFIVSFFSIRFAFDYLAQPAYLKNGQLTQHFIDKFSITQREGEIVQEIIQGFSNKEISDKLFISYKTVENHLSNIYQKVQVKNRVQLNNLVQSNKE
ncbi:MAG: response regulator transcription factor [Candidatus Marinimicrobia bacterium]|nr:response regulator transcription factor [Candidatus Neomarinimicrobiota bacterium]